MDFIVMQHRDDSRDDEGAAGDLSCPALDGGCQHDVRKPHNVAGVSVRALAAWNLLCMFVSVCALDGSEGVLTEW